jgi:hypothetical protein
MMADACRYPLDIPKHVWMEAAAAAPRRHGISQASAIFARRSRPCGRPAQPWRAAIADGMDIYTGGWGSRKGKARRHGIQELHATHAAK